MAKPKMTLEIFLDNKEVIAAKICEAMKFAINSYGENCKYISWFSSKSENRLQELYRQSA